MKHLLSYSVYQDMSYFGDDIYKTLFDIRCDGLEMLTSYNSPPYKYRTFAKSVHLPYAVDWLSAWLGHPHTIDDSIVRYIMYGHNRDEIVENIKIAIECAQLMSPAYGVMHAGSVNLNDVYKRNYTYSSNQVLNHFCEMMNTVMSEMPKGEPPFMILFENLWWPGLRLINNSDFRLIKDKIEFNNWGICLDTGHLMNCLPDIRTEMDGIDALIDIFYKYEMDLINKIETVHFHYSASYDYRSSFKEVEPMESLDEFMSAVYLHVSKIDQHMPFSKYECRDLIDILRPQYVTHEMQGSKISPINAFKQQRSLLI